MSTDAIVLLKDDHKEIRKALPGASSRPARTPTPRKGELVDRSSSC